MKKENPPNEEAKGTWVNDSQFVFRVDAPVPVNPYVAVLEGTISTPGANKK